MVTTETENKDRNRIKDSDIERRKIEAKIGTVKNRDRKKQRWRTDSTENRKQRSRTASETRRSTEAVDTNKEILIYTQRETPAHISDTMSFQISSPSSEPHRTGTLQFSQHSSAITTPNFLLYTQRGSVTHLTVDNVSDICNGTALVQIPLLNAYV